MSEAFAGSLRTAVSLHRRPGQVAIEPVGLDVKFRDHWKGLPLVIEEKPFKEALGRELRRAERFAEAFAVVVVAYKGHPSYAVPVWKSVIDALAGIKRDTDIVGWLSAGSQLGMIVPAIDADDESFVGNIASRMEDALVQALDADERHGLSVRIERHGRRSMLASSSAPTPVLPLPKPTPIREGVRAALKRAFDAVLSVLLMVALSPLLLVVALAIRLSSRGPVLFKQIRVGKSGRLFTMYKFRTMHEDADSALHKAFVVQFMKTARPGDAVVGAPFKISNDPRVTTVGRFLRVSSLDELPQLWNVIRGEMSLVGPRPPLPYEVEHYQPWQERRVLGVTPGMTGLWQVSGRSRVTFDDMVRLDLRYAKKRSLWTDLKILLATPRAVITGKGAR